MSKNKDIARSHKAPISKYASKFVGNVMTPLIDEIVDSEVKNKVVGKWLAKFKLNVQKKVSIASRAAFKDPGNC